MKETDDLMACLRRLIELEDAAADDYSAVGLALSGSHFIEFGTCMFRAGQSHQQAASRMRTEPAAVEAKYGAAA